MQHRKEARAFLIAAMLAGIFMGAASCRSSNQSACLENSQLKVQNS